MAWSKVKKLYLTLDLRQSTYQNTRAVGEDASDSAWFRTSSIIPYTLGLEPMFSGRLASPAR